VPVGPVSETERIKSNKSSSKCDAGILTCELVMFASFLKFVAVQPVIFNRWDKIEDDT
jgi:hypothetical protein